MGFSSVLKSIGAGLSDQVGFRVQHVAISWESEANLVENEFDCPLEPSRAQTPELEFLRSLNLTSQMLAFSDIINKITILFTISQILELKIAEIPFWAIFVMS